MPCDSGYLAPNRAEIESNRVANLLVFVHKKLNKICPVSIEGITRNYYGSPHLNDEMFSLLCSLISTMSEDLRESIVYDSKSKESRDLANWWEEHQEEDNKRKERESFGLDAQS